MKNKIIWQTNKTINIGGYGISSSNELPIQVNQKSGLILNNKIKKMAKNALWPLIKSREDMLVDGFIEHTVGKWIKEVISDEDVFLEIGCGDMSLLKYVPEAIYYNAMDLLFRDYHVERVLRKNNNVNIAVASATDIPIESNTVSLIVSTEAMQYIPDIDKAIKEVHRIAKQKATFICSIPNNYCRKYKIKGPHPESLHDWTFEGFAKYLESYKFKLIRSVMKGYWIPIPTWITRQSYQIPITSENEEYNTNFFYMFEAQK